MVQQSIAYDDIKGIVWILGIQHITHRKVDALDVQSVCDTACDVHHVRRGICASLPGRLQVRPVELTGSDEMQVHDAPQALRLGRDPSHTGIKSPSTNREQFVKSARPTRWVPMGRAQNFRFRSNAPASRQSLRCTSLER